MSKTFSSCTNFNFYKVEKGELVDSRNLPNFERTSASQAVFLQQIEARVLICGDISERDIETMNEAGITVVSGASGNALQAADAYLHDVLEDVIVRVA